MANEVMGKKLRYISQDKFESITPADDELYAVSGSGIGFPSSRYEDLALGVTGTEYTAPANGWFAFGKRASAAGQFFNINYLSPASIHFWSDSAAGMSGNILGHFVPVIKGQTIRISYNAGGETVCSRFIYAEGE